MGQVVIYSHDGSVLQTFDYSSQQDVQHFAIAAACPVSNAFVVGSVDHLHVFSASDESWGFPTSHKIHVSPCPSPGLAMQIYASVTVHWSRPACGTCFGSHTFGLTAELLTS